MPGDWAGLIGILSANPVTPNDAGFRVIYDFPSLLLAPFADILSQ
jgi:hypothetical protein